MKDKILMKRIGRVVLVLVLAVLLVLFGVWSVQQLLAGRDDMQNHVLSADAEEVSSGEDALKEELKGATSDRNTTEATSDRNTTEATDHSDELLKEVLLGTKQFRCINGSGENTITIFDVPSLFDTNDEYMKIWEYAVVDLDADGQDEVVLFVVGAAGDTGGKLILHRESDEVYGYKADNRKLVDLKTDGTFYYSEKIGGTEDGIAVITNLSGLNMEIERITYAKGKNGEFDSFAVDGEPATEEEYMNRVSQQDQKTNAKWYEFSEENINSSF
ncbi:MAG: hypothetical protein ACI4FY_08415 [Acetatifactor sp.]